LFAFIAIFIMWQLLTFYFQSRKVTTPLTV